MGVLRDGEPITDYPVKTLDTGIEYERQLLQLVPEIEEREAARFSGYKWSEWRELARQDRVDCLAYFRLSRAIEMNVHDAQRRDSELRARRQQAQAGGKR